MWKNMQYFYTIQLNERRTENSENRAVIRCEINRPVELGRDSNWIDCRYALKRYSGRRWTADDSDRGNKSNSGGDDSFDFRFDRLQELKAWLKNVPVITATV